MPEPRTPLEMVAFAAWINCPVDMMPPEYRQHTCEATMTAWRRVVEAIQVQVLERAAEAVDAEWRRKGGLNCTEVCAIIRALATQGGTDG